MASQHFFNALIAIVSDLPREMPSELRYQNLLDAMKQSFPCDAACLLRLNGELLEPLAIDGLSRDTMGRRFEIDQHPRLARALHSRTPIRFPADSELPDPYDGLIETSGKQLHVHDCMGVSLYIDNQPWGVLTLDAAEPGTFDQIDPDELRTFIRLSEATIKAAQRINVLEAQVVREQQVTQSLLADDRKHEIIGNSTPIKTLKNEIEIVAKSHLAVLILGETGVGKELVARQLHQLSPRKDKPLIHVNCAALPENIAESELFGHVKGAFSGAVANRSGKFELADGGTLFLDEIGELPQSVQAKFLRVLQSGEIQRVGSDQHIEVDVRIIAATNRDLEQEVAKGHFRSDLFHRLSVYPVLVPPLRERHDDVLLLAGYILEHNQRRFGVNSVRLDGEAQAILLQYHWPGNVRELEHLLSRAILKAVAEQGRDQRSLLLGPKHLDITPQDITTPISAAQSPVTSSNLATDLPLKEALDQYQRELITHKLNHHQQNRAAVARELGINRSNLYRLLKRLGLE